MNEVMTSLIVIKKQYKAKATSEVELKHISVNYYQNTSLNFTIINTDGGIFAGEI